MKNRLYPRFTPTIPKCTANPQDYMVAHRAPRSTSMWPPSKAMIPSCFYETRFFLWNTLANRLRLVTAGEYKDSGGQKTGRNHECVNLAVSPRRRETITVTSQAWATKGEADSTNTSTGRLGWVCNGWVMLSQRHNA